MKDHFAIHFYPGIILYDNERWARIANPDNIQSVCSSYDPTHFQIGLGRVSGRFSPPSLQISKDNEMPWLFGRFLGDDLPGSFPLDLFDIIESLANIWTLND